MKRLVTLNARCTMSNSLPTDFGIERLAHPFHGILLGDTVRWCNPAPLGLLLSHTSTWALENNVEVHTINTSARIVLKPQVNVLVDTKAEVASLTEVLGTDLVVGNLEPRSMRSRALAPRTVTCVAIFSL